MKLVIVDAKIDAEPVLKFKLVQESDYIVVRIGNNAQWSVLTFKEVEGKLRMQKVASVGSALIAVDENGEILDY